MDFLILSTGNGATRKEGKKKKGKKKWEEYDEGNNLEAASKKGLKSGERENVLPLQSVSTGEMISIMRRTHDEQRTNPISPGKSGRLGADVTPFANATSNSLQARSFAYTRSPLCIGKLSSVGWMSSWAGAYKSKAECSYRPNKCRLIVEPRETDAEPFPENRSAVNAGLRMISFTRCYVIKRFVVLLRHPNFINVGSRVGSI